jgi:3'-5' exoribonuclease
VKQTFISDLVPGNPVDDIFVVMSKKLRDYSKGAFLSLVLSDRTGCVNAVVWENAEAIDREVQEGNLVRITGFIGAYNNAPQIRGDRVEPISKDTADIADFVESLAEPEAVEARLRAALSTIEDPWLSRLVDAFLTDRSFLTRFRVSSAAKNWHHAYRGGLLKHTTELVELAAQVAPLYPDVRRDFLLVGAFLHDVGKVYELETDWTIDYSTIGRMLGHIVLGNQMALDRMRDIPGFPAEYRMIVQHLILSHQGELEFASPVVPKTLEAILLHHLDDMSAKAEAFQRVIRQTRDRGQEWSEYQRLIARQIWAGAPVTPLSPAAAVLTQMSELTASVPLDFCADASSPADSTRLKDPPHRAVTVAESDRAGNAEGDGDETSASPDESGRRESV